MVYNTVKMLWYIYVYIRCYKIDYQLSIDLAMSPLTTHDNMYLSRKIRRVPAKKSARQVFYMVYTQIAI